VSATTELARVSVIHESTFIHKEHTAKVVRGNLVEISGLIDTGAALARRHEADGVRSSVHHIAASLEHIFVFHAP
jgi:hypothetical protein